MQQVTGRVRDIHPNAPQPTLELIFPDCANGVVGQQHKDPLTLEVMGTRWEGTIGIKPPNPPYVHTRLRADGVTKPCTEVLLGIGLAEGAVIRFDAVEVGHLRLAEIVDRGRWRPGGAPSERRHSDPKPPPRAASKRPTVSRSGSPAFPKHDREAVLHLAEDYWTAISDAEREEERAFERELPDWRARGYIDKAMFVRLARWKSVRKTPDYLANSEEEVRRASSGALQAGSEAEALAALTRLRGVAARTASALLHWLCPNDYPILDVRVLAALGVPEPPSYENAQFYSEVAGQVRALARSLSVDLRTIDRALWTWDKLGAYRT